MLTEPHGRSVRLTSAGLEVAAHAISVLDAISGAEEAIRAFAEAQKHEVKIVSFPSVAALLLPAALGEVNRVSQSIRVTVSHAHPASAMKSLEQGECHLAIIFAYRNQRGSVHGPPAKNAIVTHLGRSPVLVALPLGHPLAEEEHITIDDLADEEWVVSAERNRRHLTDLFTESGLEPKLAFEADDYIAGINLVGGGVGIALMPQLVVRLISSNNVAMRPLAPTTWMEVSVVTNPAHESNASVQKVRDALLGAARTFLAPPQ